MTPTPPDPDAQQPDAPDQGLPPRHMAYVPVPCERTWMRTNDPDWFILILDTGNDRSVTYWQRDAVKRWRDATSALLGNDLTIADADDLAALRKTGDVTGLLGIEEK